MDDFFDWVVGCLVVTAFCALFLFVGYMTFIVVPVSLYTDAECLRKGYPKSQVTIGLERYCINLAGDVTVTVEKAGK